MSIVRIRTEVLKAAQEGGAVPGGPVCAVCCACVFVYVRVRVCVVVGGGGGGGVMAQHEYCQSTWQAAPGPARGRRRVPLTEPALRRR